MSEEEENVSSKKLLDAKLDDVKLSVGTSARNSLARLSNEKSSSLGGKIEVKSKLSDINFCIKSALAGASTGAGGWLMISAFALRTLFSHGIPPTPKLPSKGGCAGIPIPWNEGS